MAARTVQDVMTPNPICLRPTDTVAEAARQMRDHDVGDVLVADGDQLVGIVTDRDIAVRCVAEGRDPDNVTLDGVYTADPATVEATDEVERAITMIRELAVRRVPVMSDGKTVGIVSIGDLAMARDPDSALADVSAAPANN
jgi:CBS domain-containing protein